MLCAVAYFLHQITFTPIILTSFVRLCQPLLGMSTLSALVAMEKVILQFLSVLPFLQSVLNPQKWGGPVCEVALQKVLTVVS